MLDDAEDDCEWKPVRHLVDEEGSEPPGVSVQHALDHLYAAPCVDEAMIGLLVEYGDTACLDPDDVDTLVDLLKQIVEKADAEVKKAQKAKRHA